MFKHERKKCYWGLLCCVGMFVVGDTLLDYISVQEHPPGGNTIWIVLGTGFIIISVIAAFFLVRHLIYLRKKEKRKKSTRVVFLEHPKSSRRKKRIE